MNIQSTVNSLVACIALDLSIVADSAITALAIVESNSDMSAIGAAGERSAWQIMPATWAQYAEKGEYITHKGDCAKVAARILAHNAKRFYAKNPHRKLTKIDIYAMWNLGFGGYRKRGFDINRCPNITRRAAQRFSELAETEHERN